MKTPAAALLVLIPCLTAACPACGQELPMFGPLPNPGKNWALHEQGTNATSAFRSSWVVFTNSQNHDVLSFYEDRYLGIAPSRPTNQGPWAEMAISLFPGGYPAWSKPVGPRIKGSEWGRNGVADLRKGQVAVESSTIWLDESGAKRLSHGFGLALGDLRLYVQHTSSTIITPELAQDMAPRAKSNCYPRTGIVVPKLVLPVGLGSWLVVLVVLRVS